MCYDSGMTTPDPARDIPIRKTTLADDANDDGYIANATPAERMLMVWQLTLDAWSFLDPNVAESEFQRHVVRVERRGR